MIIRTAILGGICYLKKTYNEIMTDEEKKKVYLFYTKLNKNNKIYFQYYSECIRIYGTEDINTYGELSKTWYPMSLNLFLCNIYIYKKIE